MLTEREAWNLLAKLWRKSTKDCGVPYVLNGSYGICYALDDLQHLGKINKSTRFKMRAKAANPDDFGMRRWPLTRAGAKARAAFCARMAKACGKKRR